MTRGTGSESHPDKDTQEPEVAWGYRVVKLNLRKSAPPLSGHVERWDAAGTFGHVDSLFITRYNCTKLRFEGFPKYCGWIM